MNSLRDLLPDELQRFYRLHPEIANNLALSELKSSEEFLSSAVIGFLLGSKNRSLIMSETDADYSLLRLPSGKVIQDQLLPITNLMYGIWSNRPDLKSVFDLDQKEHRSLFVRWFLAHASQELFADCTKKLDVSIANEFGVNLVGFPKVALGLGEDLRTLAKCLEFAGIPANIVDVGYPISDSFTDVTVIGKISEEIRYPITIFNMPGMEQYRLKYSYGDGIFRSTYNIGYWPWELSRWPKELNFCFELVDEVWAISKFVQEAYSKSTEKPVVHMPLSVQLIEDGESKLPFELPNGFKFLLAFDFHSSLNRKNPYAAIEAFRKAFQNPVDKVNLVVKCMRAYEQSEEWKKLRDLAESDPRIVLINETLTRSQNLQLFRECQVYVSLHRAEGFCRGLAEALLLGKPVVCTNYSGNLDFCNEDNSFLVDWQPEEISNFGYPYSGTGQVWANPAIESAAEKMRQVYTGYSGALFKAEQGKKLIMREHNVSSSASRLARRLQDIRQSLAQSVPS